jgi:hypothetical protein
LESIKYSLTQFYKKIYMYIIMFNLNRANRNGLMSIAVLIAIITLLTFFGTRSKYQPRPIDITPVTEKSIFDIECTAGHGKEGDIYSMGLTPGGLCGSSKLVGDHASYQIDGGIGGSLI